MSRRTSSFVARNASADDDSLYIDEHRKESVVPPRASKNVSTAFETQWEVDRLEKPYDLTPVESETGLLQDSKAYKFSVDPFEFSGAGEEQQRMLAHESPIEG